MLCGVFISSHTCFLLRWLWQQPFVFGAGSWETCSEHFAALEDFFLGSGLLNFHLALVSASGVY